MVYKLKVIAGIVTYNPELQRLKKNVEAIIGQVREVVIFDNHSNNLPEIAALTADCKTVTLIQSGENVGIAAAFNRIIAYCSDKKVKWVLLLDQDSVCPDRLIRTYLNYVNDPEAAVIAPLVIDQRRAKRNRNLKGDKQEIRNCVSSGSFVNIRICEALGGFEEQLFIDVVDYEYCMRARLNGYKILQINRLILDQEFGNVTASRFARIFQGIYRKTKISWFSHMAYTPLYSPLRVNYTIRNWVYCIRKYKSYSYTGKEIYKLIKECLIILMRGKHKIKLTGSIIKGIRSGIAMKVNPVIAGHKDVLIELM